MRTAVAVNTGGVVDQAAFAEACRTSGLVASRCDLLWNGNFVAVLAVTSGTVQMSRKQQMYARLSGFEVVAAPEDLPTVAGGRLSPAGWEVAVWGGLRMHGQAGTALEHYLTDVDGVPILDTDGALLLVGTETWVSPATDDDVDAIVAFGVFPLESAQVDAFGSVAIDAWDRSSVLAADLLQETLAWPGTFTTLEQAVESLVRRTFPDIAFSWAGATHTCPSSAHERDASPLDIITNAATSVGYFARFTGTGGFTWGPEPDQSSAQSVATFGDDNGLVDVRATISNRDVNNAWTVIGANPAAAGTNIVATVYDDTPGSPTQWGGAYKRRPKRAVRMELIDTQAKADAAALAMRAAEVGFGIDIDATVVPHYLVEPGDAVLIQHPASGLDSVVLIEEQTIPLAPGPMQLRARARQAASA